ncbi:MAG: T9SS type A sorting domain-containing protein [Chitinophagales bacterium]|nr:T9SS type A sorting domain-containing protein [Chitinophagales bacterium]
MVSIPKQESEILAQVYGDIAYSTSVTDHELSELIIYPNPSTGVFRFKNQDQYFDNKVDLISMDGKFIEHLLISNDDIDLMHLPSGQYYIVLHAQGFRKSAKLIISK